VVGPGRMNYGSATGNTVSRGPDEVDGVIVGIDGRLLVGHLLFEYLIGLCILGIEKPFSIGKLTTDFRAHH